MKIAAKRRQTLAQMVQSERFPLLAKEGKTLGLNRSPLRALG